jgi:Na+/H+-dicarboxylate symporter
MASAVIGLYVGSHWSLNDLPEQFQEIYTALYRMMALPFLVLTIVYAISRIQTRDDGANPGRRVMILLPSAMIITGVIAIAVSSAICNYQSDTVVRGIGALVAAFQSPDASFVEVSLSASSDVSHSSVLLNALADMVPSNLFSALATMNLAQIIIFLIVFSIAILHIPRGPRLGFVTLVGAMRRPFQHMIEKMQILVPIAVFFYAVHASHAVSAKDLESLKLLFGVIAASSVTTCFGAILLVSIVSRTSPLRVAADMKDAIVAGVLAVTEEAALAMILEKIRRNGSQDEDEQEVIASLGLAIGRFGMITVLASVLTYTIAVYQVPATFELLFSILCLSIVAAVLITGLNGPGVLAAALTFCGGVLGLPIEALLILVILLEPLLEILLIPVSVTMTNALVVLITAIKSSPPQPALLHKSV